MQSQRKESPEVCPRTCLAPPTDSRRRTRHLVCRPTVRLAITLTDQGCSQEDVGCLELGVASFHRLW